MLDLKSFDPKKPLREGVQEEEELIGLQTVFDDSLLSVSKKIDKFKAEIDKKLKEFTKKMAELKAQRADGNDN